VIQGRNIICFASGWDYHPTSKHHVMRALSRENNVIWVNWHASRRPKATWADVRAIAARLWQIRKGARRVTSQITTVTPWQVPMPGSKLACQFNAFSVRRAVQKVLDRLPDWPVQIWSFAPDMVDLVGAFGEELVVYYCVDAFGEFPGYDADLIERRERELMARSDLVFATSPPLYETKRQTHDNVHFIQHGVNHAHLSRAVTEDFPIPEDLKKLPRPILGFVGVIGEWVDLSLVAGLAKRCPDASVVMIGPEVTSRGPCAGLKNIHWLGGRDHVKLPAYLQHFDVGLIPFTKAPLAYNANPIKLFEYLAAGVPVVSSSLPVIQEIPDSVWLADDADAMARQCRLAAGHNEEAARQERSDRMTAESWSARLEQMSELALASLPSKKCGHNQAAPDPIEPLVAASTV
jgi:glycosyltransferase involved in cell wall biosynthesis